jgi:hypothetical protein
MSRGGPCARAVKRTETTDGRYVEIGEDEWWDTTGVESVDGRTVEAYMAANRVGWTVVEESVPTLQSRA